MFDQLRNVYKGKRVFITGHTGFKGSWLLKVLHLLGAEIKGYALPPYTKDDLYNIIDGTKLCNSIIDDLRNKNRLTKALLDFNPDFVFHLAAQPLVRLSYEIPSETFETNAIGTAYLLDAVAKLKTKATVILVTTDKVYHNNEWLYPYRETDRLGGYDPYSASKACAELVIDSYRNSFFNPKNYGEHQKGVAVARAGNVIGGGDWSKDRLLPDIARALGKNETVVVRNPNAVRPWQHVLEPVFGYLLLGEKLEKHPAKFSQAYNFGPYVSDNLSVKHILDIAIEKWQSGSYIIEDNSTLPHEAGLLRLDISKAVAEIGWQPGISANGAIELTIDWYKTFFKQKEKLLQVTEDQINLFMKTHGANK